MHPDPGLLGKRLDDLPFDREVDLGGEIVAFLLHGGLGAVPFDERLGRLVQNRGGLSDQSLEVGRVQCHRRATAPPRPGLLAA